MVTFDLITHKNTSLSQYIYTMDRVHALSKSVCDDCTRTSQNKELVKKQTQTHAYRLLYGTHKIEKKKNLMKMRERQKEERELPR